MNGLHATIRAETLKRVISALKETNDQAIFEITPEGLRCSVVDPANAQMTIANMPAEAWGQYDLDVGSEHPCHLLHDPKQDCVEEVFKAGIDLEWMMAVLDCTSDTAKICLAIDENGVHLNIEVHGLSRKLLKPETIRKLLTTIETPHTATMGVTGGFFKRMIGYLRAIDARGLEINASRDNVAFLSHYEFGDPRTYNTSGDWLTWWSYDARGLYSLDYLTIIAEKLQDTDLLTLQWGTKTPLQIRYAVGECDILQVIAPRIYPMED